MGTIVNAKFVTSSPDYSKCPPPLLPEYAFIGRSNVGKSSLINMITMQRSLAKTSSTPGKTKLINHFLVDDEWYLVDLPGYGYARTAKSNRFQWEKVIEQYLLKRPSLMTTFILIDSRLTLQKKDQMVINWFGENQLAFLLVLTKTDKLTANQLQSNQESIKRDLLEEWEELPVIIRSSAKLSTGKDEILAYIQDTNRLFQKPDR